MKKDGYTVAINYERYQSLDDSAHIDSLLSVSYTHLTLPTTPYV